LVPFFRENLFDAVTQLREPSGVEKLRQHDVSVAI
jgi:hypothetical protein